MQIQFVDMRSVSGAKAKNSHARFILNTELRQTATLVNFSPDPVATSQG